jgi:hypothetical protein
VVSARFGRAVLAAVAAGTTACSVLFDPGQFRTTDAGLDAFGPDATGECPLAATSTSLPICTDTSGLYYCPANDLGGDFRRISSSTAAVAVPARGHRLGVLGNGIEAWRGARLTDFELVREGDGLAVVTSEGTVLQRRRYDVTAAFLTDTATDTYAGPPGVLELGDVAIPLGVLDGVAVSARDGTEWAAYTCPLVDTACSRTTSFMMQPATGAFPLLAYAGTTLVTQLPTTTARDRWFVQRLQPAPYTFDAFVGPEPERLRSVGTDLVFADGAATAAQRAYEPDDDAMRSLVIGAAEPRVATLTPTTEIIGRAREVSGGLTVSVVGVDCAAAACECPSCSSSGFDEAFVPLEGVGTLVDWTFQIVDGDLRVAVFLVGDSSGTDVLVAWWRPVLSTVLTIEHVVIGSGRLGSTFGIGHSLRSVARRIDAGAIDRLEVFVATHVTVASEEFVFLSGLRLEGCGS